MADIVRDVEHIVETINMSPILCVEELEKDKTAVVFINTVKGYFENGALACSRYRRIVPNIVALNEVTVGYDKLFINDGHTGSCLEFNIFPSHCILDSEETQIIPELTNDQLLSEKTSIISKNSANAFFAPEFKKWLDKRQHIESFIIAGVSVDVSIVHLALSLKSFFIEQGEHKRVIVPMDCVDTYDFGTHNGDLSKYMILCFMKRNGIEIVRGIE